MNILDIAIAKQLAGGGGGSGTDNYNDLSNLPKINDTTLSGNKSSSALGLQSEINSDSKLASDLVDDTNQDNKFVTASDKETWNAKQNAIDNSHKLSSDLVDDANHTNKFVTSTEKQTWNAKQNAIDADHKLSSSLVSFTDAEAAALASGIDSSKVNQISTNQTNILLLEKMNGAKNYIDSKVKSQTITTDGANITVTVNPDKSFEISGTTGSSDIFITICEETDFVLPAGAYVFSGLLSGAGSGLYLYMAQGGSYVHITNGSYPTAEFSINSDQAYTVAIHLEPNKSYSTPQKIYPMICDKSAWDSGLTQYMPYALPNYDLTVREAEDRAALVEVVDSGAKNIFNIFTAAEVKAETITRTINADGTVTVSNSGTNIYTATLTYRISLVANTQYVISGCPSGGSDNTYSLSIRTTSAQPISDAIDYGSGSGVFTVPTSGEYVVYLRAAPNYAFSDKIFKPMVCTEADWKVSKTYQPYRPSYDLLITKSDVFGIGTEIVGTAEQHEDLDNYKTIGKYHTTSGTNTSYVDHIPTGAGSASFILTVENMNNGTSFIQTYMKVTDPTCRYERRFPDFSQGTSTWTPWYKFTGTIVS